MLLENSALRLILAFLLLMGSATISADESKTPIAAHEQSYYVIETSHRVYPDFLQVDTITPGGSFLLGEEEYVVSVVLFNPHLGITQEGEYLTMSDTLYNPAIRVEVKLADSVVQQSWGFNRVGAPHYYRDHMFGFRLADFKVDDRFVPAPPPPAVPQDSAGE